MPQDGRWQWLLNQLSVTSFLGSISWRQLIQNSAPSTILRLQCYIRMALSLPPWYHVLIKIVPDKDSILQHRRCFQTTASNFGWWKSAMKAFLWSVSFTLKCPNKHFAMLNWKEPLFLSAIQYGSYLNVYVHIVKKTRKLIKWSASKAAYFCF